MWAVSPVGKDSQAGRFPARKALANRGVRDFPGRNQVRHTPLNIHRPKGGGRHQGERAFPDVPPEGRRPYLGFFPRAR